ncbi:hypothetical protein CHUAL_011279 [Chamberlinius hualienensis]
MEISGFNNKNMEQRGAFWIIIITLCALVESENAAIVVPPSNTTAKLGQSVTLKCEFSRPVMCFWIKNGNRIVLLSKTYSIKSKSRLGDQLTDCSLTILSLAEEDFTKWTCWAFNDSDSADSYISKQLEQGVTEKPEAFKPNFRYYYNLANVTLLAEGYEGNQIQISENQTVQMYCKVDVRAKLLKLSFVWEQWSLEDQEWKQLNFSTIEQTTTITDMGLYRCGVTIDENRWPRYWPQPTISTNIIKIVKKSVKSNKISTNIANEFTPSFYGFTIGIPLSCIVFIIFIVLIIVKILRKKKQRLKPKKQQNCFVIFSFNFLQQAHSTNSMANCNEDDGYLTPISVQSKADDKKFNKKTHQQCPSELYDDVEYIESANEGEYSYATYNIHNKY